MNQLIGTNEPQDYLDNIVHSATDALVLGIPMNLVGKITYKQALTGDYKDKHLEAWKHLIDSVVDTKKYETHISKGTVQDK